MSKAPFFACLGAFLFSCATTDRAASGPIPSARQAQVPSSEATVAAPVPVSALRVRMSTPSGWQRFQNPDLGDGALSFRNDAIQAVVSARIIPADGASLDALINDGIKDLAVRHVKCKPPTVEGESYAVAYCKEERERNRGIVAMRRPRERPDALLVMVGIWSDRKAAPAIDDEIDLMFLLASVE